MNYSAAEISKFNQFANNWWDPNGPMKPLHQLNPLRLRYIEQHTTIAGKHIIDVGCGAGLLSESLAKKGSIVTAIDMSDEALLAATSHAEKQQLTHIISYQKITIEEKASITPASQDSVTCMELLEHVPDPASVIHACSAIAKKDAVLFFSTINRTLMAYVKAIVSAEYLLQLLPPGTHHYQQFICPAELDRACRQAGLKLINLSGLSYHPMQETFSLTTDVSVNYIACYKKLW